MTDLRQAAQQALEALEGLFGLPNQWESGGVAVWRLGGSDAPRQAITALKAALEQQAEPPPEWLLIKNILDEYGLQAIDFVVEWKAAQQQAEPVAYLCENAVGHKYFRWKKPSGTYKPIALYTDPPQRPWVGLTEDDIAQAMYRADAIFTGPMQFKFAKELEAKLKERNT